MSSEFSILEYLTQWGPTVIVLSYGFWLMYGMFKNERDLNTTLQNYVIESDKSNYKVLKDLKDLLRDVLSISASNKASITTDVKHEAEKIINHIDLRMAELNSKSSNNSEK